MTEKDVDVQAFMTGEHEVVTQLRNELIRSLESFGPDVTAMVLEHVANVSYRGDVHTYLEEAKPVMAAALLLAMQPTLDRLRQETDASRADIKRLEAHNEKFMREFEEFRQMKTPKTIQ